MGKFLFFVLIAYAIIWWIKRSGNHSQEKIQMDSPKRYSNENPIQEIPQRQRKIDPQYVPRQIDLSSIPYIPLPPSPIVWQYQEPEIKSEKNLFELIDSSHCSLGSSVKLEDHEKPALFYKKIRLQSDGCLFIDPYGKNDELAECKASLMKRSNTGSVVAKAGLENDIYRIATNPLHEYCGFMSSNGIFHAYNGKLEKIFEHNFSIDPRIIAHYESALPTWGTLKTHIRTIDLSSDGNSFLFTIVDTAWCIDKKLNSMWGISLPLNEGWERIIRRTTSAGPRDEIMAALSAFGLSLPVSQDAIKKKYRELAFKLHPDYNKEASATEKMQQINAAFEKLTGVDPNSLEIKEKNVFDYRKRPDYTIQAKGFTISVTLSTGSPQDWIYASAFAADSKRAYLGSYAGKIIKVNHLGEPVSVYDVASTPRSIIDTGDYLYILTNTRLYILKNGEDLIEIIDIKSNVKLIVGDKSFGLLGEKHLKWYNEDGVKIGILATKNPIRSVYPSGDNIIVETRQHRNVLSISNIFH